MFEQETDTLIRTILQRLPQAAYGPIGIKDILAADIPHPIKTFFRADVESMLLSEQQKHHGASRFKFDHHEVRSLQEQINSILVLNYMFERKEFERRVDDAVHMIINYLIRPQWTLSGVIFEKDKTISSQALVGMLQYFGPYEYLREIVFGYLSGKQIGSLTMEEFNTLVWKIDGEYIKRKSGDELAKMLSPIYDFFGFTNKTAGFLMPVKAIIRFFEDKGLAMVIPRFEGDIVQGKTELNRHELAGVLEDIRRTFGAFQVEKIEVDHKELIGTSGGAASESTERLHKIDFVSEIDEPDRRKFIGKIFHNDEPAFHSAMKSLNDIPTWKQASKFIDEIFIRRDIDPYSSEATRFMAVIFGQYHPKNK